MRQYYRKCNSHPGEQGYSLVIDVPDELDISVTEYVEQLMEVMAYHVKKDIADGYFDESNMPEKGVI